MGSYLSYQKENNTKNDQQLTLEIIKSTLHFVDKNSHSGLVIPLGFMLQVLERRNRSMHEYFMQAFVSLGMDGDSLCYGWTCDPPKAGIMEILKASIEQLESAADDQDLEEELEKVTVL